MTFTQVMALPLAAFWSANRQIDRIAAEKDQRQLQVSLASQSGESAKELFETLRIELGSPAVVEKGFDLAKFEELRREFGGGS